MELRSDQEPGALLSLMQRRLADLLLPSGSDLRSLRVLREGVALLERRWQAGPDAPLRLAFFGPTGAGKSKLFNSLLRADLSSSGFRRPFTMQPVFHVHQDVALRHQLVGSVHVHNDATWRDLILIDTPDFDSVEQGNRGEAERIFQEADAFLFVTDVQKYADQSNWEYLEQISSSGKPFALCLNKVTGDDVTRECFQLWETRLNRPDNVTRRVVVREYPIDDATLLPEDDPGMDELRGFVVGLVSDATERRALVEASFGYALNRVAVLWEDLRRGLEAYEQGLADQRERVDSRYQRGALSLEREFQSSIDQGLKREVYNRVLERMEKIDPLRYPRKLLALPVEGLKSLYRRWRPSEPEDVEDETADLEQGESFRVLEGLLLRLAEETRKDFMSEERCPGLLPQEAFFRLPLPREELETLYRERIAIYGSWLREEAQEAAASVTTEHKAKFILSQVIYNTLVVGAQIHTAGAFTAGELLTDSLLSPLVAKAVGMALSSERVRWFEKQAQAEYHRLLAEIVKTAQDRFIVHLDEAGAWREGYPGAVEVLETFTEGRGTWSELFPTFPEEPREEAKDEL
jgi:hypothetical protein